MKKFLIYSGVIISILLLLYFGLSFWLVRGTATVVEARRQAIRNAGENVLITDYQSDPIPDEENAYHFLMLARADLAAFDNSYLELEYDLDHRLSAEHVASLNAIAEEHPELCEQLEQAAACPRYHSQIDYSDGMLVSLDHINMFRSALRALQVKALVEAYQGNGDLALEQCRLSLKLTSHLQSEPILISHLVHIACQGIAVLSANHVLRIAETSAESRAQLDEVLAEFDNRQVCVDVFKGERAFGIYMFQRVREGTISADELDAPSLKPVTMASGTWLGQAYLYDDEAKFIDVMNRQIEVIQMDREGRRAAMDVVWSDIGQFRHQLTRYVAPALNAAVDASDRADALNRCLRILLAIEGHPNSTVDDVALSIAEKTDPFSGRLLLIKREAEEPIVYSVWKNGVDDGGQVHWGFNDPLDQGLAPLLKPLESEPDAVEFDEP